MQSLSRRSALTVLGGVAMASSPFAVDTASAQAAGVTKDMILNDPDQPVGGNPKGDVTIVAFLDYNCPFCKKSAPDLVRIVKDDGRIRLVYKDWPILAPTSAYGARLALAAKYQGKYEVAHHALMAIHGHGISEDVMLQAVEASGIDRDKLKQDLSTHAADIEALIKRNLAIGDALELQGTPIYLVGPFKASTLDYAEFKLIVADARAKQASK